MSYYNRHEGNLFPGKIAKSEDVHQIQTNIQDAIKNLIEDQYDRTSFILGSRENDFLISPAPKRFGRYIDTMNLVDSSNELWLDIDSYGYRQAIKTTKTSLYSVIVKLRNMYSESQDVSFELWSEEGKISKQTVTVPAKTSSSEFEIVFNLEHFSTQHGRSGEELERPDAKFIAKPGQENLIEERYDRVNNPDNHSLGATTLYLVVKAIHKATETITSAEDVELIDENTFMICADSSGSYAQGLERTADDGRNYESTKYDLHFKHVYSNAPTYLCTGGTAVVHGEPVLCNDSHVTVDGASNGGHTKSYIAMDIWGQLKSYTSHAYWGDEANAIFDEFPVGDLIIAIIYTYNGDIKQPKIVQDDNLIEDLLKKDKYGEHEFGMPIRQRSHHERIRRLEKEMAYHRDIALPSRLKYNLTGEDVVDTQSTADDGGIKVTAKNANKQLTVTSAQKAVDWSKYFLSTDKYGNFVVKSVDAETTQIPVTLKESATIEGKTGIKLAQTIVASQNAEIDRSAGIVSLAEHKVAYEKDDNSKKDKDVAKENVYQVGTTAKEAKKTEFNPWDDKKANRPETADIKPTEREFVTKKGVNGVNVRSSEYPAMTLYLPQRITLKELIVPIVKFKNVETVQFHIWERQGPNNKHNTVWLEKLVYSSKKFSLKNAKTKDGFQILDKPFKIEIKNGLKMRKHQYIILVQIVPKSGNGSVFVETYKPKDSSDFLIRYHGSADCAHFRLKTRYREIWYTSATKQTDSKNNSKTAKITAYVDEFYKEGRIESGEVVWENSEPIASITPSMNATIPDGCSIELQANAGSGWKTLENEKATKITGGTSSFKWRALLKGTEKATPEITYDEDKNYAINFSITKQKPQVGAGVGTNVDEDKNVLTTQTFYPGDILQKYIGDTNLNTCDKFSNYEWIRIYGENSGDATALIDIAASDTRYQLNNSNNALTEVTTNLACAPISDNTKTQFDIFTMYYADLTFDDFVQESVDYSNYDNNIEYDEHNLRFKIDTDRAYNDDDIALFNISNVTTFVPDRDESLVDQNGIDNNPTITVDTSSNYITAFFKQFTTSEDNLYSSDNSFIWKYTLPDNKTLDLSNYSALKIGYNYNAKNTTDINSTLSGLALYISSAIEQEAPSNNYDVGKIYEEIGKEIREYEDMAPETLTGGELERYKNSILKVTRVKNDVTYVEYYYYVPDEDGVWRRQQYHDIKSFTIYNLSEFNSEVSTTSGSNTNIIISIDNNNDNFKHVKEIGLIALSNAEDGTGLTAVNSSELQFTDVKGIIQGYNTIYSAEKSITLASSDNSCATGLFRDASNQISSITRIYYNRLNTNQGKMIGYINNDSITTDANNFAIQFVSDTYLPKDSILINLCAEKNGVSPIFSLNMPTLNHVYYDSNLQLSSLFDRQDEPNKIKTPVSSDASEISALSGGYTVTSTPTAAPNFPSGKTAADYTGANRVEYKITIEPGPTTLNVNDDIFYWYVYKQEVTKSGKTETYGTRDYIGRIKQYQSSSVSNKTPTMQVKISNTNVNATYASSSGNTEYMTMDSEHYGKYGMKIDYDPGQYKIKIGFQGYSVVDGDKLITYRSAQAECVVDIYWKISNTVKFAQVYKKISEDKEIKSISINTTDKFKTYMNTLRGTSASDASPFMHIFIKNMVLHEAEHIPLFHPNMRMKIYSKANDGNSKTFDAVGIRKVGAVIEYK